MNNDRFEHLWQTAEAERYSAKMAGGYGAWRTGVRRKVGVAAMSLALLAVGVPLASNLAGRGMQTDSYLAAHSNCKEISNQYWVDMAEDLLLEA